jgi:hypothetical protein
LILNNISGISKEWLSFADIARAMETAFDSFIEKGKNYQCLLIIITKGQLSNDHVADIRRYAGAFKARGWPVCIVCDREQANRTLLVAANNREFNVQFTDKTSLSDWIDNVRITSILKNQEETTIPTKPKLEASEEPVKTEDGKSTSAVIPDGSVKQPIEVKIVELPREKAFVDATKPVEGQTQAKAKVKQGAGADNKVNDRKKRKSSVLDVIPIAILLTMILGAIGLVVYFGSKPASKSASQTEENENIQHHLIALVFDQRYDLGASDEISEITIGKGIGSTIYIDNETVEDKHLRIFRNRNGLKVQNLAPFPVTVNGIELTPRRKTILDLPADIQLTPEVTVTILSELLEMDKEVNSRATENI